MDADSILETILDSAYGVINILACDSKTTFPSCLIAPPGIDIICIDSRTCETQEGLFDQWGRTLEFPDYFGRNWDAFEECLNDLDWLPMRSHIVLLLDMDESFLREDKGFKTFCQILGSSSLPYHEQYGELATPIVRFVFHCTLDRLQNIVRRLERLGVQYKKLLQ